MTARIRVSAAQVGVSTQTVSRALRGSPAVTPTTAARIRAAAEDLGYLGNEAARTLRRGQTRTIGLLLTLLTVAFWPEVAVGAESLAHEKGYSLLLCDTSDSFEKEASYLLFLLRHRVVTERGGDRAPIRVLRWQAGHVQRSAAVEDPGHIDSFMKR